jgi:hypothetical protein
LLLASILQRLWDNAVAGGAAVAILLGLWLTARQIGLLNRPKHWVRVTYLPPRDAVGFFAMPHFLVEYENRGNVPIVFSDFILALPRLEGVIDEERGFVTHVGAELFIDKRPTSTIAGMQQFSAVDYRTDKVRLDPGDSHTDFFDLGAFLPDMQQGDRFRAENVPHDFSPIITFHDSFGNNLWADEDGVRSGLYEYPHDEEMLKVVTRRPAYGILSTRKAIRWLGWTSARARGLGEATVRQAEK